MPTPIADLRAKQQVKKVDLRWKEFQRLVEELFSDDPERGVAFALKVHPLTVRRWMLTGRGIPATAVICLRAYKEFRELGRDCHQPLVQGLSA